jgi:hypothetical protein
VNAKAGLLLLVTPPGLFHVALLPALVHVHLETFELEGYYFYIT